MSENRATQGLYVPLQPSSNTDTRTVDLRILSDGRVGLTAYTSLASLIQGCGDAQAWGMIDERGLAEIRESAHIDVVLLDAELPMSNKRFRSRVGAGR